MSHDTLSALAQKILWIASEKESTIWLRLDRQGQPSPIQDKNRKVQIGEMVLEGEHLEDALSELGHDGYVRTENLETAHGRAYLLTEAGLRAARLLDPKIRALIEYLEGLSLKVNDVVEPDSRQAWTFQIGHSCGITRLDVNHDFFNDWTVDEIRTMLERAAIADALLSPDGQGLFLSSRGRLSPLR